MAGVSSTMLIYHVLLLFPFLLSGLTGGPALRADAASTITVRNLHGKTVRPLVAKQRKATVLLFIAHDCPISNAYAPEISRIYRSYRDKQIAFYLIYVDPGLKPETAAKHSKDYRLSIPALLDPSHKLVELTGAMVTPEAAVVGRDGKLLYRGRIDDLYLDFGKRRHEATKRDLREALDAVVAGKKPAARTTKAVGCYIPSGN
jgi:thiol-disulfide isomerase/thioredoxin